MHVASFLCRVFFLLSMGEAGIGKTSYIVAIPSDRKVGEFTCRAIFPPHLPVLFEIKYVPYLKIFHNVLTRLICRPLNKRGLRNNSEDGSNACEWLTV